MEPSRKIDSLEHFKENMPEIIERLKVSGQPLVLTVDGEAELVVQDVSSYRSLMEIIDRVEAIEGIRKGLESMERGKGRPAAEVFEEIRRRHQIPRDA